MKSSSLPVIVLIGLFSVFSWSCSRTETTSPFKVVISSLAGCGSTAPTIDLIKETAGELGLEIELHTVLISTMEEAVANRHIGSPTIRINGLDIEPAARTVTQYGLA